MVVKKIYEDESKMKKYLITHNDKKEDGRNTISVIFYIMFI